MQDYTSRKVHESRQVELKLNMTNNIIIGTIGIRDSNGQYYCSQSTPDIHPENQRNVTHREQRMTQRPEEGEQLEQYSQDE